MKHIRFLLLFSAIVTISAAAGAQTATQLQQQQTDAAVADQAARTKAATQGQQLKTMAASEEQARKTNEAAQAQANKTAERIKENQGSQTRVISSPAGTIVQNGNVSTYYPQAIPPQPSGGDEITQAGKSQDAAANDPAERQLQSLFNQIDVDHNGLLTKTEFSIYYKTTAEDTRFKGYDANKDMNISYFEFRAPNATTDSVSVPRN